MGGLPMSPTELSGRPQWEYRVLTVEDGAALEVRAQDLLNELGSGGWELVAVRVSPFS
jgi:hypothetical protein